MAPDIQDVANLAGVSTATVSRALRGLPNVSSATRERVLAAAAQLDYVSSPTASRLASGHTHSIGIVAPYVGRWFFGQVLSGAERVLREAGFDVLLIALPDDAARTEFFARMPLRRKVDAVLVLTLPLTSTQMDQLRQLDVPIGTVGSVVPGLNGVSIDDVAGARMATNHLINLGHTRIGLIGGGDSIPTHFVTPDDRRDGYREALASAGIEVPAEYEVDGSYTTEGGEAAMAELLGLPVPPTAVFAQSDEMAMGALSAIRRAGLDCPRDISLVGFDDHQLARVFDLTTIAQPAELQGELAAMQILANLAGGGTTVERVPTRLVLRGTTRPPRHSPNGSQSSAMPPPGQLAGGPAVPAGSGEGRAG